MSEANKAIVRRFYQEVMNQGNVDVLDEIMASDFKDHGETLFGSPQGRDMLKQGVLGARSVLANLNVQLHDVIADDELVGVRGTMRWTAFSTLIYLPNDPPTSTRSTPATSAP